MILVPSKSCVCNTKVCALCPTSAETLNSNLQFFYTSYNYHASHIWNCDESGVQVGQSGGATVLAKLDSRSATQLSLIKESIRVFSLVSMLMDDLFSTSIFKKDCIFLMTILQSLRKEPSWACNQMPG